MKTYFRTPKQILKGEHQSSDYLIASIYKNTNLIIEAQKAINKCEHPLLPFCSVIFYNQLRLVLGTQSNMVATKFRFEKSHLLVEIKRMTYFAKLQQLDLKLIFNKAPINATPQRQNQYLSEDNTTALKQLQQNSSNDRFNTALEKLIRKHGKQHT